MGEITNRFLFFVAALSVIASCVEYKYRNLKIEKDILKDCTVPENPEYSEYINKFKWEAEIERRVIDVLMFVDQEDVVKEFKKYVYHKNNNLKIIYKNYQLEKGYRQEWQDRADCQEAIVNKLTE